MIPDKSTKIFFNLYKQNKSISSNKPISIINLNNLHKRPTSNYLNDSNNNSISITENNCSLIRHRLNALQDKRHLFLNISNEPTKEEENIYKMHNSFYPKLNNSKSKNLNTLTCIPKTTSFLNKKNIISFQSKKPNSGIKVLTKKKNMKACLHFNNIQKEKKSKLLKNKLQNQLFGVKSDKVIAKETNTFLQSKILPLFEEGKNGLLLLKESNKMDIDRQGEFGVALSSHNNYSEPFQYIYRKANDKLWNMNIYEKNKKKDKDINFIRTKSFTKDEKRNNSISNKTKQILNNMKHYTQFNLDAKPKKKENKKDSENKDVNKKDYIFIWRRLVMTSLIQLFKMKISFADYKKLTQIHIPYYENPDSVLLFQAVKEGDREMVIKLIKKNNDFVYINDDNGQTILHWMAKRNRFDLISFAVKHGALINAKDNTGRTPLHLAAFFNRIEAVMILLYEMANPFLLDNRNCEPSDITTNDTIHYIMKRIRVLYFFNIYSKIRNSIENIRRGLTFMFDGLNLDFNNKRFCIYYH